MRTILKFDKFVYLFSEASHVSPTITNMLGSFTVIFSYVSICRVNVSKFYCDWRGKFVGKEEEV